MFFEVGKKVISPCDDCVKFDITETGADLVIAWTKPTEKELNGFQSRFEIREIMLNGIIFICFKPGDLDWQDAPYHRDLSRGTVSILPPDSGEGLLLHVLFIDAATGVLKYQRILGLSTGFTKNLYKDIAQQPPITATHQYNINTVYAKYNSDLIAGLSRNSCVFEG